MRQPTEREIFLQNLLATSSTLLYRSVRAMERGTPGETDGLIIEIEGWFAEAQARIKAALAEDEEPAPPLKPTRVEHLWTRVEPTPDDKLDYFLR